MKSLSHLSDEVLHQSTHSAVRAELALEKWDPVQKAERALTRSGRKGNTFAKGASSEADQTLQCDIAAPLLSSADQSKTVIASSEKPVKQNSSALARFSKTRSRAIPSAIRHAVWMRDRGRCVKCGSTRNAQVDHDNSFALGGEHELSNLRVLCRSCNQRHAIETYGLRKMSSYLRVPQTPKQPRV